MNKSYFKLSALFCAVILTACSSNGGGGSSDDSSASTPATSTDAGAGAGAGAGGAGGGAGGAGGSGGSADGGAGAGGAGGSGGSADGGAGAGAGGSGGSADGGAGAGGSGGSADGGAGSSSDGSADGGAGAGSDAATATKLAAIQNLKAERKGVQELNLNWDAVEGATNYYIYFASEAFKDSNPDSEENKALRGYAKAVTTSNSYKLTKDSGKENTDFAASKDYFFKIIAQNGNTGAKSDYAEVTSKAPEPMTTAPANLKTERQGFNKFNLSWDAVEGATGYEILITDLWGNNTSFTSDTNSYTKEFNLRSYVSPVNFYTVKAYNATGSQSAASDAQLLLFQKVAGTGLANQCFYDFEKISGGAMFADHKSVDECLSFPEGRQGKSYYADLKEPNEEFSSIPANLGSYDEKDCLLDRGTGLVWEQKTHDNGLHDYRNTFAWDKPGLLDNSEADESTCRGITKCNTTAYIAKVNEDKLCGRSNWRLPTASELLSIANFRNTLDVQRQKGIALTNFLDVKFAFYDGKDIDGEHRHYYWSDSYYAQNSKGFVYYVNFKADQWKAMEFKTNYAESALGLINRKPLEQVAGNGTSIKPDRFKVRLVSDSAK